MKSRKLSLLVTLIVSFIAMICTAACVSTHSVYAQETAEPVLIGGEIEEEYVLGDYLSVPEAQISFDGKTETAKVVITKPNGEAVQTSNVALEQGGVYGIEYRAIFDGKLKSIEKTFIVQTPLFSANSQNSFAVYGEDVTHHQTGVKGSFLTLAEGDVLKYNDIIDLKASNGHFLEFFLLPQGEAGTIDLRKLTITLTDVHDPSIVLTTILQCYRAVGTTTSNWFYDYTYVLTGGQNQKPTGLESNKVHVDNEWGSPTRFSFYGKHGDNIALGNETLKLIYSEKENAVYANGDRVVGLDDLNYFEEAWNGFTTGEVRMTIQGDGYSLPFANLMITKIGENNLNKAILVDDEAPEITVDYDGYDSENLPKASKGNSYPVFTAEAKDRMSGNLPVKTTVYYSYESDQRYQVQVVDGEFKTDRVGVYTIEYTAVDAYQNVGKKTLKIECGETSPAVTVEASGEYVTEGKTGELLFPADIVCGGGTGKVVTYATIKAENGEEMPMGEGFRPENAGTYTVTLYAEDMLGKIATYEYALEVAANTAPIFLDEVILPRYFLAGYEYELPALNAYDYANGKTEITTAVSVKDGAGERELDGFGDFTADADGYATIIYTATGALGNATKEYKVRVVNPWAAEESLDMSKYFYGDKVTTEATESGVLVSATEDAEYQFVNPVIAHKFRVKFSITENEFTSLQLVFADSQDESIYFTIDLDKASSETETVVLKINGVETRYTMPADFYNGKSYYFEYDAVNQLLLDDATLKQTIKNADGSVFEGFPSRKIYVTAKMQGVTGNAAIEWSNFGGQVLSDTDVDMIKPAIMLYNDYASSYAYKAICEIYPAVTADVLSPETVSSLTVYDPSGAIIKDVDGLTLRNVPMDRSYFVNLQQYGSYSVMYTSRDMAGRTQTYYYALYVTDTVAPKIVLEGEMQTEIQRGQKLNVVKAISVDNVDGEVLLYTYVKDPSGVVTKVENGGSFVATQEGVYEIRYISIDSFGNLQMSVYKVTVLPGEYNPQKDQMMKYIYIGAAAAAVVVFVLLIILIVHGVKKSKEKKAKAKALQSFVEAYGDIRVDVAAMVYDDATKESSVAQVNEIINGIVSQKVEIPEGGKMTKRVKIKKDKEEGGSNNEK